MNKVRNEAIHFSNTYKVQTEPFYSEGDRFIPTLEKEFLDILNKILCHDSQQQPLSSNENTSMPHRDRVHYNSFR